MLPMKASGLIIFFNDVGVEGVYISSGDDAEDITELGGQKGGQKSGQKEDEKTIDTI